MLNCPDNHCPAVPEPLKHHDFFRSASSNDPGTWETIVNRYSRLIDFWCLRYGAPRSELDNHRQEVFIRLAGSIGRFQPRFANGSFQAFLKTLTRNQVISAHRETDPCGQAGSLPLDVLNAIAQDSPEEQRGGLTETKSALYQKVIHLINENFSAEHAFIFIEYVVQQRKPSDIAAELNISTNVVYQVRSRILNYLREKLGSPALA